jgi:tetratricopeptide (TPR) repeat protein
MFNLRIFISSPGDVGRERETSGRVIARLQAEFRGLAQLEPYFWEYEPMMAVKDFQENIPSTAEFDIVVCILWSRLGSRLHSKHQKPDGTPYESGTEFELVTATEAYKVRGTPELLVYLNKSDPIIPARPKETREDKLKQYDKLEAFLDRWFRDNSEGVWQAAFNEYRNLAEFEDRLEMHLRKLVRQRLPEGTATHEVAVEPVWNQGSPFRGLEVFDFDHAPVFFGRTKPIDDVLTALRKQSLENRSFVLVLGASGSGKSSLVRAGILPLLIKPGVMEGVALWRWSVMRPADVAGDLFLALASALTRESALPELISSGKTAEQLAAQLRSNPDAVAAHIEGALYHAADLRRRDDQYEITRLAEALSAEGRADDAAAMKARSEALKPPVTKLVLVIDQLEEIFTLNIPVELRDSFVRVLSQLARTGFVAVLATLRSDFYARCQEIPELVALTQGEGLYSLLKPTPQELGQIIRQPALAAGLQFEFNQETQQGLDEVLRDAAVQDSAVLPLLEFALDQIYERRSGRILTYSAYHSLGGVEGSLANRAEEEYGKLGPEIQEQFDQVMSTIVTLSVGQEETFNRRWAIKDELTATDEARILVEAFIEARLFQTDQNKEGQAVVSICHEALFLHWPRLASWLEENRQFLRHRSRIQAAAAEWAEHDSQTDYLLLGSRLTEAKNLYGKRPHFLGVQEVAYLEASSLEENRRAEAELLAAESARLEAIRRSRSRLQNGITIGSLCLAALILMGWIAHTIYQKNQLTRLKDKFAGYEAAHDIVRAGDAGSQIISLDPQFSEGWKAVVRARIEQHDYPGARKTMDQWAAALQSRPVEIDLFAAQITCDQGNPDQGLADLQAILSRPDLSADLKEEVNAQIGHAVIQQASTLMTKGDYRAAAGKLENLLSTNDIPKARVMLLKCLFNLRNWYGANSQIHFLTGDDSDPDVAAIRPKLDRIQHSLPQILALDDNVKNNQGPPPTSLLPSAYYYRAKFFAVEVDLPQVALEDVENSLRRNNLAMAPILLRTALLSELNQSTPTNQHVSGSPPMKIFSDANPDVQAIEKLDITLNDNPIDDLSVCQRASALSHLGEYDLALQEATRAAGFSPPSKLALAEMAVAYLGKGDLATALDDSKRAIQGAPDSPRAWAVRAIVLHDSGTITDEAVDAANHAILLDPNSAELYKIRADLLRRLGRAPEAQADETKASQLESHP